MATVSTSCPSCQRAVSYEAVAQRMVIVCPNCQSQIQIKASSQNRKPGPFESVDPSVSEQTSLSVAWIDDDGIAPEDVFRNTLKRLFADGVLSVDEKHELSALRTRLAISVDDAKRIFDEEKMIAVLGQTKEIKPIDATKTNKLLQIAEKSLEAGQPQEAIEYFNKVLEEDPENSHAWFGKARASLAKATLGAPPFDEAMLLFKHAIDCAPEQISDQVTKRAAQQMFEFTQTWYAAASSHLDSYAEVPSTWTDFVVNASKSMGVLEIAYERLEDPEIAKLLLAICEKLIRGVAYSSSVYGSGVHRVPPDMEKLLEGERNWCAKRIKKHIPDFELENVEKAQNCFVVTACLGDTRHPDVVTLRTFRDEWLLHRWFGREMVRAYHIVGPALARLIGPSRVLRCLVASLVVSPLCFVVRRFSLADTRDQHPRFRPFDL